MNIRNELVSNLSLVVKEMGAMPAGRQGDFVPSVEASGDLGHGDFTTNAAMILGKRLKRNPMEVGEEIRKKFSLLNGGQSIFNFSAKGGSASGGQFSMKSQFSNSKQQHPIIEKIEVVRPGFVNFWLSKEYLLEFLKEIDPEKKQDKLQNKKIMVEFTDPNPFKEFHIGHLYSNTVGEAISRLLESQGADVWRVCYQGDVGLHVAKALWGMMNMRMPANNADLKERVSFLGKAYANGVIQYDIDVKEKEVIIDLNRKIYSKDPSIFKLYQTGKGWSLDYFERIYKRLGTSFKKYYFESEVAGIGLQLVKDNIGKVFKESEGAIIFPGNEYGLHTRVFINSQGLPTYEAKELGLASAKYEDFHCDLSISVTGNEINQYFKVVLKALSLINPEMAGKIKHISHGMVRLPSGKMSSRTGEVVTAESLLEQVTRKLANKIQEVMKKEIIEKEEEFDVLEKVAIGAVKYAFLKSNIGSDIVFNFDESISFEGNWGFSLQYTYARTQSVLKKAPIFNFSAKGGSASGGQFSMKSQFTNLQKEEVDLMRLLVRFGETVQQAGEKFAPNILCNYLFMLAQAYNLFYQKHQILKEDGEVRIFRLALTEGTGKVIKEGLRLLGIEAPERM